MSERATERKGEKRKRTHAEDARQAEKLSLPGAWIQFKHSTKEINLALKCFYVQVPKYATLKFNTAREALINRYK